MSLNGEPSFALQALILDGRFSPSMGYGAGRESGETGFGRCFGPTSEPKSGLLTIDENPASAYFLEPGNTVPIR